jgi:hypothetical protein
MKPNQVLRFPFSFTVMRVLCAALRVEEAKGHLQPGAMDDEVAAAAPALLVKRTAFPARAAAPLRCW